jgi:hypothetical protein
MNFCCNYVGLYSSLTEWDHWPDGEPFSLGAQARNFTRFDVSEDISS